MVLRSRLRIRTGELMRSCKCGCGSPVKGRRVFVNKEHQLTWMYAGGAREMNALLPESVRQRGGHTTGVRHRDSGLLRKAGLKGARSSRRIAAKLRARRN